MKKRVLKIAALILVVVFALSLSACSKSEQKYPNHTEKFFINDFAEIMTAEDAETIYKKGATLQAYTSAQMVVVTQQNLGGESGNDYAVNIGRLWKVGDAELNNGVVVLWSQEENQIYVAIGEGLEGALPDSKVGRIIDTNFTSDNVSAGIVSVYDAIMQDVYNEYNVEIPENYVQINQLPQHVETASAGEIIVSWIILIILIALYIAIFGKRGGLFILGAPRFFGGFHYRGGFGGFGGFGGGSSGGFRGGGGSFGGGGAGRKF